MGLAKEDIELIQQMIDSSFKQLDSAGPILSNVHYDLELRERTVRVEEELKRQRDLMLAGFAQMEKRFEQVDKRFELIIEQFDKRFEQVDKRFEDMDKHFELIVKQFDKRFEQVDKQFEQVDKRFEQMHLDMTQGFAEMNRRLDRFMYWSLAMFISLAGVIKFF